MPRERQEAETLEPFFRPHSVAVIGATDRPGSVGLTVMKNLQATPFGGGLVPVNPRRDAVLGLAAYPCIEAVPGPVDLAVIVTPATTVPGVVAECAQAGVRAAIVISAGFRERGEAGAALEQQMLEAARRGRLRLLGPNCLGLIAPGTGLNATFAAAMPRPGRVAFLSQSGALCTAILDWSLQAHVGFSAFVSMGSMLDVGWGELIEYLGDDPATTSILIYMESIGDGRAFLSAARKVAPAKPIIVIKAGRSDAAVRAAASHTGALAGSDLVLDAAFRRSGVLRVDSLAELFSMADVLGKQPRPGGPRLTIVTNAGGPGVLATDTLIANGGELAMPSAATLRALDEVLPSAWSHGNPIDILGDASVDRYRRALRIAMADEQSDGLLVIYCRQGMTSPAEAAAVLQAEAPVSRKPVLASWMGGEASATGRASLDAAGIPAFAYPDAAARTFTQMWRYTDNLRGLDETPARTPGPSDDRAVRAAEIMTAAQAHGRTLLTEVESKGILAAYGLPVVDTRIAMSDSEAVEQAEAIGYPVVLKVHSETVTHKAEAGGVVLDLTGPAAVREAFGRIRDAVTVRAGVGHFLGATVQPMVAREGIELILGSSLDAQFGPVLLFGAGGRLVEVYRDRALALPPLTSTLARRLMEQTKIFAALRDRPRGVAVDVPALEQLLVRFSQLVVEQRRIREIDINPLLASGDHFLALDARVILHPASVADADLPEAAIQP